MADRFDLEAMAEVDAMLPGTPRIGPPSVEPSLSASRVLGERLHGALDEATQIFADGTPRETFEAQYRSRKAPPGVVTP